MRARNALVLAVSLVMAGAICGGALASGRKMTKTEIIERIEATGLEPEIHAIIDLELAQPPEVIAADYRIEPQGSQQIAIDGSGGMFSLMPDGRILLIDSEGSFGIVASDFNELVAITTGLPSWRDALRFMGEPDIKKAEAAWSDYVRQWGLDKGLDKPWPYGSEGFSVATPGAARQEIRTRLGITASADPFSALHRTVNQRSGDVTVFWQEQPLLLFGRGD